MTARAFTPHAMAAALALAVSPALTKSTAAARMLESHCSERKGFTMRRGFKAGAALVTALVLFTSAIVSASQSALKARSDSATLAATEEILKSVSRLRGLEIKHPVKSGLKTHDEIERSVISDLDRTNKPEEFEATTRALEKLGLVPKGFRLRDYFVKLLREQVAGFYEPKTQEFYLASWVPISEQKTVIAHELAHALQDQHFNLRRFENWPEGDSDAETAAHALVEGEATLVMFQYAFEQQGVRFDVTKMGSITEKLLEQDGDDASKYPVLAAAPAVLRESLQFPYVYGAGFVQQVLKSGSWPLVNSTYSRLPVSTEQIMHPERFLVRDNPIVIDAADLQQALGAGWKRLDADVNGQFGYQLVLAEFIGKDVAREAAKGWGGDRYVLYENQKGGHVLLAQHTTWDSERDAREFFDAYCERTEKRYRLARAAGPASASRVYETAEGLASIELRGSDVVIVEGAQDAKQLGRVSERMWLSKKAVMTRGHGDLPAR
jgi:hypothetical protein